MQIWLNLAKNSQKLSRLANNFGTLVVIISLIMALFKPNIVTTASGVLATLSDSGVITNIQTPQFPEIGERMPIRTIWVVSTSYSSDPKQTDSTPCLPAMNYDLCASAEEGIVDSIAANFLKLGTKVRFPDLYGDKIFTVRDRMNARYNGSNRIDVYSAVLDENGNLDVVSSTLVAKQFGVKRLKMEIL